MIALEINVDTHGPLFDGVAREEVHRYVNHVTEVLGNEAVERIRAYLPTQYMYLGHNGGDPVHNPVPGNAGYLQASVHMNRMSDEMVIVNDDPVTYGAWIEGVDIMNSIFWRGRVRRGLSPRFPGYHAFRIIGQQLQADSLAIAERELHPYVILMNT